jgi:hypothetical protein
MRRVIADDPLPHNHPILNAGERLYTTDVQKLGIKIAKKDCRVLKPNGDLLFMLVKDVIPTNVWQPAYDLLKSVSGSLANRPDIIAKNLRLPGIRKNGTLGKFNVAPSNIVDAFGGNSDLLGYFKYKNPAPGVVDCAPTAWTIGSPQILGGCTQFICEVDRAYRTLLPEEYAAQLEVISKVPPHWRMFNTAFTTLYVLKNAPTAVHKDLADAKGTFGCMATLSDEHEWEGNEIVWPEFRVGCDYRPGDILLGDVHEWHTNLPKLSGNRVSCVFFVQGDIQKCPI